MTLRDIPDDLQQWLRSQAQTHRRSLNREILVLLETLRAASQHVPPKASFEELRNLTLRSAALPIKDARDAAEILGFDDAGIPTR